MGNNTLQTEYDSHYVANRIARTIRHVKLVKNMVSAGADCTDVLIQLAAVRGQLDSISGSILTQYSGQVAEAYRLSGDPELVEQFKAALTRAIRK